MRLLPRAISMCCEDAPRAPYGQCPDLLARDRRSCLALRHREEFTRSLRTVLRGESPVAAVPPHVRTYVRVTARPWKPAVELDGALARGDLRYAIALASEVAEDRGRPIDLDAALRFLPIVAAREPSQYDAWALRWLGRWIAEGRPRRSTGR